MMNPTSGRNLRIPCTTVPTRVSLALSFTASSVNQVTSVMTVAINAICSSGCVIVLASTIPAANPISTWAAGHSIGRNVRWSLERPTPQG
ncbi:hypothetical protein ACR9WD_10010 [Glutamicibacter sp. PAEs-4]|uniref:hypothetical protein n=1 Tax=Glutamicibacter TaxID=1742989 RepID=UPI0013CED933|nr:hypothetical protein [Glutamicibacter nicotianae]